MRFDYKALTASLNEARPKTHQISQGILFPNLYRHPLPWSAGGYCQARDLLKSPEDGARHRFSPEVFVMRFHLPPSSIRYLLRVFFAAILPSLLFACQAPAQQAAAHPDPLAAIRAGFATPPM
ncbi:MAG: hypothetical protein WBC92_01500, partial [Terracidiphilus sp.]